MFLRIKLSLRRDEIREAGAPQADVTLEKVYADDMVGELQAADDAHKLVDQAIDRLYQAEKEHKDTE